ncbi:hypothetical protein QO009_000440 [Brevibacillus aydinogluensis]|jgi:hypothetical protein|uniref:hypothetical protein n=1 Tax=Brevibacillus aydinogluensis TaxID=927786 RepID=UPI002892C2B8|nr:hypothetical protein [Brevibacillus aydinogluensis]MDT3414596.1 hypothetical protein [Brevibacillus aydinogluensis]
MYEIKSSLIIVNFYEEMFNDALYYLQKAQETDGIFEKWRYYRSTIINCCISAESYLHNVIVQQLQKKNQKKLYRVEKQWLNFLSDYNYRNWPKKATNIKTRFNTALNLVASTNVKKDKRYQSTLNAYIALSNIRNSIVHYAPKDFYNIYQSQDFEKFALAAPNIVDELVTEICRVVGIQKHQCFSMRSPRIIT